MNRKLYWGLFALIIMLIGAFVLSLRHERGIINLLKDELAKTQEQVEDNNKQQPEQPIADGVKKPPPGKSPHGHWHGDEWHDKPHLKPIVSVPMSQTHQGYLVLGFSGRFYHSC